jgi:ParB family chromosome partitioning protein
MASIKKMAVGRKDTFMMCPSDIKIKPDWNIRKPKETDEDIINLSKSIAKRGVIEAVTIDSDFFLTDGHRRLCAVGLAIKNGAEIRAIPCAVEPRYASEADKCSTMLVKSGGGSKQLAPLQKGIIIKRLISLGWTEGEVAENVGMSKNYVLKLLDMQAMPETLKGMIEKGVVSASVALDAQKEYGERAVEKITAAATQQPGETKKKRVTKKTLDDRKPQIKKELKALEVIRKQAGLYSEEDFGKINDLCSDLELILIKEDKDV